MRDYYRLTKPGIVYGNALSVIAGFLFAAGTVDILLFIATVVGLSVVIASACVTNNVLDQDMDIHMIRTKDRAIPAGRISTRNALLFAAALAVIGFGILILFTNTLATLVTLFGVIIYVGFYTPLKRVTVHSTIVGALAGAVPPVVGYVAVANTLDVTALLLFLILTSWQMTHFFAIGIFRLDEYRSAGIPVLPVRLGIFPTKIAMTVYTFVFAYAVYALALVRNLGGLYTVPMGILSLGWILFALSGFGNADDTHWAKRMFFYSLFALLGFCAVLSLS